MPNWFLILDPQGLRIYPPGRPSTGPIAQFAPDDPQNRVTDFIERTLREPCLLLVDLPGEQWEIDTLPPLSRRDREQLIARRQSRRLAEGIPRIALSSHRSRDGEIVLLGRLDTPSRLLAACLEVFTRPGSPPLALLTPSLVAKHLIHPASDSTPNTLIVLQTPGGWHTIQGIQGKTRFARTLPHPPAGAVDTAKWLETTLQETLFYLQQQTHEPNQRPERCLFLLPEGTSLPELTQPLPNFPDIALEHQVIDASDAHWQTLLRNLRADNSRYDTPSLQRRRLDFTLSRWGRRVGQGALALSTVAVLAANLEWTAQEAAQTALRAQIAAQQAALDQRTLQTPTLTDWTRQRADIRAFDSLRRHRRWPQHAWKPVGQSLINAPSLTLNTLSWRRQADGALVNLSGQRADSAPADPLHLVMARLRTEPTVVTVKDTALPNGQFALEIILRAESH